ncbi:hypothetical protein BGZ82_010800, partial [Podila clonocystis]
MFAQLPELLVHLSRYLNSHNLVTCVQVSSQWHSAFIPFLWHTINETTFLSTKDSDLFKSSKGREWLVYLFRKYGHLIRNLAIRDPLVLEAASIASTPAEGSADSGHNGCTPKFLALNVYAQSPLAPPQVMEEATARS